MPRPLVLTACLLFSLLAAPAVLARDVELCANYTHEDGGPTYALNAWASTEDRDRDGVPDHGVAADPAAYDEGLLAIVDDLASDRDPHLDGTINVRSREPGTPTTEASAARARGEDDIGCQYAYD